MFSEIDHIYYINLDHRTDRNEEIQNELKKMEMPLEKITRFSAIYDKGIGGVGCGKSHIAVLQDALEKGYNQILVLEDDFTFCTTKEELEIQMEKLKQIEYDICLISYSLLDSSVIDEHSTFLKVLEAQTTSGYIVKRHYIENIIQKFEWAVENFAQTNYHWLYAIDIAWKPLQLQDNWICFHPRAGKQRASYSDCSNTFNDVHW